MTEEELAEGLGYHKVKGVVVEAGNNNYDYFIPETEIKEYWFNEQTEIFFENTEEGLKELCDFEEK